MAESSRFVVVEFIEERAVEVVHRSWIELSGGSKIGFCYWPKFSASQNVKKCVIPDKNKWRRYKIRVLSFTDDYKRALHLARLAEDTSNLEDEEAEEPRSRYRKKPRRYGEGSDSDHGDDENEDDIMSSISMTESIPKVIYTTPTLPSPPVHHPSLSPLYSTNRGRDEQVEITHIRSPPLRRDERSLDRSSTITTSPARRQESSSKVADGPDNFKLAVLMKFEKLDQILENQREQLALLKRMVANAAPMEGGEDFLSAQLENVYELEQLCQQLSNREFNKKLTYYLSSLGGRNTGDRVRRMVKKIGTYKLWSAYSLKGRKGKKAFNKLPLCNVLIKACMHNNGNLKVSDVEAAISETLKYAPKKRDGTTSQEADIYEEVREKEDGDSTD